MNPLILLHGALGTSDQLSPLLNKLDLDQPVHVLNFEGHGDANETHRPFRMEHFVENVLDFMDTNDINEADLFGYSMGGYVAMMLAKTSPERIGRVSTLGTVLKWSPEVAEREVRFLNPEKIREKVPQFAEALNNRHPGGWEQVAHKTKDLLLDLGSNPSIKNEEWAKIDKVVRIHVGDRDATTGLQQSIEVYSELEKGELAVLPNSPHPLEQADLKLLAASLNEFFAD